MPEDLSKRFGNIEDDWMAGYGTSDFKVQENNKTWTGKVIDVNDPLKIGRVRVKIFGIYEDIPDETIPWALPQTSYLGASSANLIVPPIDTVVRGFFEDGDLYKPIYTSIISTENPEEAAAESYAGMRGPGDSIMDDAVNSDYPHTMVLMKTDDGEGVTLNRRNGTMKITHRSGLKMQIDPNGSITIEQSMSKKITTSEAAKMDVTIEGDFNLTTNGEVNINAQKNVYIDAVLGDVNLGRNSLKTLVCAHPACFVTGAPTNGGNTNVKA